MYITTLPKIRQGLDACKKQTIIGQGLST